MLVKDYMHKNITSVSENSPLRRVIRVMKLHRMSAVPIVDIKGDYAGCITAHDILNASIPEYMKMIENTSFMANLDQVTNHLSGMLDKQAIHFIDKNCASTIALTFISGSFSSNPNRYTLGFNTRGTISGKK